MADSRQYWMDEVIRRVAEENMNPEVLSGDYGDPRFSRRPMKPESEPYMGPVGGLLDAVMDKVVSGARKVDEHVPRIPGSLSSEQVVRMLEPLRGRDVGATGEHEGDILPMNALMKASLFPVMKFGKSGLKNIAKILGIGGDEAVDVVKQADQLKLPRTARTKKKKLEPEKPREKTIDKLSRKARQEEALENQGELFSRSPIYDLEARLLSQKQYNDLIDEGWKHQDILDAHPRVPYSERRKMSEHPINDIFKTSPTPKIRKPATDMGIHFGKMADESGYTKLITGGDPELTQLFYDTLDWKYMNQPYTAAEAAVLKRGQGRDIHAIYDDIRQFWLNSLDEIDPVTKELTTQQTINFNEAVNEKNASNWLIDQAKLFGNTDDLLG